MKFYHGTTKDNFEKIISEGILFGRISNPSEKYHPSRCTYLAVDKEEAKYYGEIILEVDYDPYKHPKMNNYIEKTIENSSLNKEKVYEKLNISAYNDKTIYNKLIKNYISSPEYTNNGQTYEILTRKGKKELWI